MNLTFNVLCRERKAKVLDIRSNVRESICVCVVCWRICLQLEGRGSYGVVLP